MSSGHRAIVPVEVAPGWYDTVSTVDVPRALLIVLEVEREEFLRRAVEDAIDRALSDPDIAAAYHALARLQARRATRESNTPPTEVEASSQRNVPSTPAATERCSIPARESGSETRDGDLGAHEEGTEGSDPLRPDSSNDSLQGGAVEARRAHNPEVAGSIPAPATSVRGPEPSPKGEERGVAADEAASEHSEGEPAQPSSRTRGLNRGGAKQQLGALRHGDSRRRAASAIRARRCNLGLVQTEAAEQIGIEPETLDRIERADVGVPSEELRKACAWAQR